MKRALSRWKALTIPNLLSASSTARVTELDGKPVEQFDLIDHFIARYGINLTRAEEVMAMDSVKLANMLCDPER
ncbi:propanediol dehydratase large subunit [Klebsiella pneumoniae subsp. ozaenae]|uniref:Propanediol dehydratase large subunit n=1 Tax=Klebsiella pneumoniae subsp. ozaenae TaxID=574 RepID=A0A377Z6Q9_KLEPO|nr:propanediol dehydratase large subunit [Klebsiella pneumoniae subsp. ozaenae]